MADESNPRADGVAPADPMRTILIVDDHPLNRKLLRAQLEAEGKAVLEAGHGVEALEVLGRESVDAVISDALMPNMDGFRLCLEIRKRPALAALPYILYTSTDNSPQDRQLARIVGADRYVVKPAPARAIVDALNEASGRTREPVSESLAPDENHVLRQYSEALVVKLEEKNAELQAAVEQLTRAHADILDLNKKLDATVQQRTAELRTANRELEAFTFALSHDLRAPLRAIGGYTQMFLRDHGAHLDEDGAQLLDRVDENVKRMNTLIHDLLEYSRLGRKALNWQPITFRHIVGECLAELEHERANRVVEVRVGDLPPWHGDVTLLKQTVVNLLANAFKYTRNRTSALIEIGAEVSADEYVFHVRDNGVGFDMRYAGKLFEVFQRLHSQREFSGTGVGLAIVRRAVEKHGGRVWARSEPERGATFYFAIPAANPLDLC